MTNELQIIMNNLTALVGREQDMVRPPYLYLDPEAVEHIFQELTGLSGLPFVYFSAPAGEKKGRMEVGLDPSAGGRRAPLHLLFEAMSGLIEAKAPLVSRPEDLTHLAYRYARVRGVLQATHFPDGGLNLEISFAGVRGLLFFTPSAFSSMIRPLIDHDRFHSLHCQIEALVYPHGRIQRTIFYHQSYGDNQEHDWIPLVPIVIREIGGRDDQASATD